METMTIAYFITPHGFGHAARASAVMTAIQRKVPKVHWNIYTLVPEWFFRDSGVLTYTYHECLTDIGVAQTSPLLENLPETLRRLAEYLPYEIDLVRGIAEELKAANTRIVVCDISPLGIAAAKASGVPAVLIENFTWDWIYAGYLVQHPQFKGYCEYLRRYFEVADVHIQTEPVCNPRLVDLLAKPVSRPPRQTRAQIRSRLGIPEDGKAVMITMGGIPEEYKFLNGLTKEKEKFFIIPGSGENVRRTENLVLLPHHSEFFHPDLIYASDAVVGKLGYSTIGEVYAAGLPFGFVGRSQFRESKVLGEYVWREMKGIEFAEESFMEGDWIGRLDELLALPRIWRENGNGADQIAEYLIHKNPGI